MNVYDYIDDYMAGQLKGEQLQAFEKALQSDSDLNNLVLNYVGVQKVSEGILELELLKEVEGVTQNNGGEKSPINKNSLKRMLILLAIGILSFIVGYYAYLYFNDTKTVNSPQEIYASVYQEPIWPVKRSGNTDYLSKGISQYLEGDLTSAKQILLDSVEDHTLGEYWLAEIYLKEQKMDSVLKYAPNGNIEGIYKQKSILIQTIALLSKGRTKEARELSKGLSKQYLDRLEGYLD